MDGLHQHGCTSLCLRKWIALFLVLLAPPWTQVFAQEWIYTVHENDNLWQITHDFLSDMRYVEELQSLNQVEDPKALPPGMRLRVPIDWLKIQPAPVRVVALRGNVSILSPENSNDRPVAQGMLLHAGDHIRTNADTNITLEFADGSQLQLFSNSDLILDTISAYSSTGMVDSRLRLEKGRLENRISPQKPPMGRFEIWTPAATSAVRGTRYRLAMDAEQAMARMEVTHGAVALDGSGTTIQIEEGYGTLVRSGEAPMAARPLLPAPDLSKLPDSLQQDHVNLEFAALREATAYRLQFATSQTPDIVQHDIRTTSARFDNVAIEPGNYVLRIRGIDSDGIEGMEAQHALTVTPKTNTSLQSMWPGLLLLTLGVVLLL